MAKNYKLRILHLSDLHERVCLDWMNEERKAKVRSGAASRYRVFGPSFIEILKEIAHEGVIDLVCFTGDIADWALPEEYESARIKVRDIFDAAGISENDFFLVPGNHDVQRKSCDPIAEETRGNAWRKIREYAIDYPERVSDWLTGQKPPLGAKGEWVDQNLQRGNEFWRWVAEDLGLKELHPSKSPHKKLGYQVFWKKQKLPFPLWIIGLDSAWLSGDDNDEGKLYLTGKQIDLLTTDKNGKPLEGYRLVLIHHPITSLADGNEAFRKLSGTVDLLLHGHQHEPNIRTTNDPDYSLRCFASGSLYEGDRGDNWINSFHLITTVLNPEGRPLNYQIQFFGWSPNGHWHRTDTFYKTSRNGLLALDVTNEGKCLPVAKKMRKEIIQKENNVSGDLAGNNIVIGDVLEKNKREVLPKMVRQVRNTVGGDLAGGSVFKNRKND
ncbi:MAG: metallophosphoesterase [Candidatus Riflebacteria bacterium]|nr:metallophosphoesterase [Candidatus Riflebacteria bacterium]